MNATAPAYADYLTEADLRLLARAVGLSADAVTRLADDPAAIEALLADPRVFEAVFGVTDPAEIVLASPFLAFGVAVHRAVADLAAMDYLPERSGLRQRIPVFDAPELRDFLGSAQRRLFLAELLASFTRVASGRYRTGRSRTRRFSELDPVRLAGLLDVAPEDSRPGIYRRLGDVSLFLAGVFPDYSAMHALGPVDVSRLLRSARVPVRERDELSAAPGAGPARIPRRPLVPRRAGDGPGADRAAGRRRGGGGTVPAGPPGAQPPGRPVPGQLRRARRARRAARGSPARAPREPLAPPRFSIARRMLRAMGPGILRR